MIWAVTLLVVEDDFSEVPGILVFRVEYGVLAVDEFNPGEKKLRLVVLLDTISDGCRYVGIDSDEIVWPEVGVLERIGEGGCFDDGVFLEQTDCVEFSFDFLEPVLGFFSLDGLVDGLPCGLGDGNYCVIEVVVHHVASLDEEALVEESAGKTDLVSPRRVDVDLGDRIDGYLEEL